MDVVCVFLLCSLLMLRVVSALFDFNASLNDSAPVSPISLPVDLMRIEKEWVVIDDICVLLLLSSLSRLSFVSVLFDFNASLNDFAPVSSMLLSVDLMRMKKNGLLIDAICVLFLLYLQPRLSRMSVVFDFNASLNNATPDSLISFPFGLMRMEKSGLLMDAICVLFHSCLPHRSSFVSAVFDFNASLNDFVPSSPILLSVDLV